jgi:phospholipid/cholesterol/gamma-HCH transport system permease protein
MASLLESSLSGDRLVLSAFGAWTAGNAGILEGLIEKAVAKATRGAAVLVDMARVERLDTFGAWLLERLLRDCRNQGAEAEVVGLPDRFRDIVGEAQHVTLKASAAGGQGSLAAALSTIGRAMSHIGHDLLLTVNMLGAVATATLRALANPRAFRLTSMVNQLDLVGWRAVPIVLLITFLIGCIIAQQGIFHFRRFGADVYVVDMVGILVLREIGVLLVAIMVAGRSGSAYTAELGAMKMREEIDALRTMGLDPVNVLILPRILALVIAVPMLTFIGSMAALYGGGLVCWLYGGMNPDIFLSRLQESISLDHFEVGLLKAPFMALVIGVVACVQGLEVRGSTESLGLRTTSSVVKSIFMVIVLDGLFAIFFASIGK